MGSSYIWFPFFFFPFLVHRIRVLGRGVFSGTGLFSPTSTVHTKFLDRGRIPLGSYRELSVYRFSGTWDIGNRKKFFIHLGSRIPFLDQWEGRLKE